MLDKKSDFQKYNLAKITSNPGFKKDYRDEFLVQIKDMLRQINLLDDAAVQRLLYRAQRGSEYTQIKSKQELIEIIHQYGDLALELNDAYMPHFTSEQISNNNQGVHVLDQAFNMIPLHMDQSNLLLKGLGIIGRPGKGKSSAVYNILSQTTIPFLGLDPKLSWKSSAPLLQAEYLEWEMLYFCLDPPLNISWGSWLFVVSDMICQITGLQFAQEPIIEACQICLRQKKDYEEKTGIQTSICLKDIRCALDLCPAKNPKRTQYIESAKTALSLLIGPEGQHPFSARQGLPLDELLKSNYFLGCQYANTYQSKFLGLYPLLYQYHASLSSPETSNLRHLTVMDDAGRFTGRVSSIYGSGGDYGPWKEILKVLRSSGEGYIFCSQLVSDILHEIRQLTNCWLVIGSIGGSEELKVLASLMNLNEDQKKMLTTLKTRECIFFSPDIERPIHGFIPEVNRPV